MEADINGTKIHFVEAGGPAALPVILIHGFPLSGAMWEPQFEALKRNYRVVAYDIRGQGESAVGDGLYSVEFFVDDLLGVMDLLQIRQAVLCGLSMGGYIALRAAERAPERVKALVLCDTRGETDSNQGKLARAAAVKALQKDGVSAYAENFAKNVFSPKTLAAGKPCVERIKRIMRAGSELGLRGTLLALAGRTDATPFLPSISVPTLILVGADDALAPPAVSEAMRKAIPGSELRVIAEAGHLSSAENPEEFNKQLLEFLSRLK